MSSMQDTQVNSIKELLDYMIKFYEYEDNERLPILVFSFLSLIERIDEEYTIIDTFPEEYGIRRYVLEKGKLGLIGEMMIESNCDDMFYVYQQYADLYINKRVKSQEINSVKELLDYTIKDYGYENNPRIYILVYAILRHIKILDDDPMVIASFIIKYGIRKYVAQKGRISLIKEMMEASGCYDEDEVYEAYTKAYLNNTLKDVKVKIK